MPEITVEPIEGGYKFRLCDTDGTETNTFSISKDIIHNVQSATGYVGNDADAIEKFRKFGEAHYPDTFRNTI